jgi:uncharacterized protein DUF4390
MNRRFWVLFVLAVVAAVAVARAAGSVHIVPIARDEEVFVTFTLADAYTDEVREAIASGLRTTFTYDIELRMVVPMWVDRTIATAVVSTSDQYDNLTRRHSLSRTVDGRVEETLVTEDETVVRRWLTAWDRLPLCKTTSLDPNRDYYVRISARARPRGSSLLGWADAITGQAKFTFIP